MQTQILPVGSRRLNAPSVSIGPGAMQLNLIPYLGKIQLIVIPTSILIEEKITKPLICRWGQHMVEFMTFLSTPKYHFRFISLVGKIGF